VEALGCDDHSRCVDDMRWSLFPYPTCDRVAERVLFCLDTETTIENFECWAGRPVPSWTGPCADELAAADELGCAG
jgi:hypothetical protein